MFNEFDIFYRTQLPLILALGLFLLCGLVFLFGDVVPYKFFRRRLQRRSEVEHYYSGLGRWWMRFGMYCLNREYFSLPLVKKEPSMQRLASEIREPRYADTEQADQLMANLRLVRFSNIAAAVYHGLGNSTSLALGIVSLVLSIIYGTWSYLLTNDDWLGFLRFMALGGAVAFISWWVMAYCTCLYLRKYILKVPLEEYVGLVSNALESGQLMVFISFKIHRLCQDYLDTLMLSEADRLCGTARNEEDAEAFALRAKSEFIQRMLARYPIAVLNRRSRRRGESEERRAIDLFREDLLQHEHRKTAEREVESARIEGLMREFASRTRIRYEEACESLFQFSPELYRSHSIGFRQNTLSLLDIFSMGVVDTRNTLALRVRKLMENNESFRNRVVDIRKIQVQTIAFKDLHSHVIELAATRSSSDAVKTYMRALTDIAREHRKELIKVGERHRTLWSRVHLPWRRHAPSARAALLGCDARFVERLIYLLYKSRAHVGLNVHFAMHQALLLLEKNIHFEGDVDAPLNEHVVAFNQLIEYPFLEEISFEPYKSWLRCMHDRRSRELTADERVLIDRFSSRLVQLYPCGLTLLDRSRQLVLNTLRGHGALRTVKQWLQDGRETIVLTYGFSKMVRDAVRKVISEELYSKGKAPIYAILQMDEDLSDAIKIKYMILDKKGFRGTVRSTAAVERMVIAEPEFIVSLIPPSAGVAVVIGADAFDAQRRFAKTCTGKDRFETFLARLRKVRDVQIRTIVVAESYKYVPDLSKTHEFLDDHYHSLELYGSEFADAFVSDNLVTHYGPIPLNPYVRPEHAPLLTTRPRPTPNGYNARRPR